MKGISSTIRKSNMVLMHASLLAMLIGDILQEPLHSIRTPRTHNHGCGFSGILTSAFPFYFSSIPTMSEKKLKTIVCQLYPNHPNGRMNRAGLVFTIAPQSYQVDEEQLLAIQNEPKIKMVEKGKRAYEVGMENPGNSVASVSDVSQTPETPVSDV